MDRIIPEGIGIIVENSVRQKQLGLNILAWSLSAAVVGLAVTVWLQRYGSRLQSLSAYQFFPLFGLLAFSLMWAHYMVSVARQQLKLDASATHLYFEITSVLVLIAILIHPDLLAYQLWRDGFGLPPSSYLNHYVAPTKHLAAILGILSLAVFLAYEFRRAFKHRPWWRYIEYLTDLAMLAIFYHSLTLGSQVQSGWFRAVWWFYGLTLIAALGYIYYHKWQKSRLNP